MKQQLKHNPKRSSKKRRNRLSSNGKPNKMLSQKSLLRALKRLSALNKVNAWWPFETFSAWEETKSRVWRKILKSIRNSRKSARS
jgi:hypothetical protein